MVVKRWLVRNNEIGSLAVSLTQHIHGVEKGSCDSRNGRVSVSCLDGVNGVGR